MSTSGGAWRALQRGRSIHCDAVQVFVKNNMQWFGKPISPQDLALYANERAANHFACVFGHAGYMKAPSAEHEVVFRWILSGAEGLGERTVRRKVNGEDRVATFAAAGKLLAIVEALEQGRDHEAQRAENPIGVEDSSAGCQSAGSCAYELRTHSAIHRPGGGHSDGQGPRLAHITNRA
jgi:hypothetical protein